MVKILYLMRHGQTEFNKLGKIQGHCDSPLTMLGIKQAQTVRDYFKIKDISWDALYCSTQERASDTLEIVSESKNYIRLKGLREWGFGLFEGESNKLNPKVKPGQFSYGDSFVAYGGESDVQVIDRMLKTLTDIMEQENHDNVLAVSHGGSMYIFLQVWLDFKEVEKIPFSNGVVLVFDYKDKVFSFKKAISYEDIK